MLLVSFFRIRPGPCLTLLAVTLFAGSGNGQGILAPPPLEFSQPKPPLRSSGKPLLSEAPPPPLIEAAEKQLHLGPVEFHPHLLYRYSYGDGIPSSPGQREKTSINEISPGVSFALGPLWHLDYTPTLRYYTSSEFRDTVDHSVALTGGTTYRDWSFGLAQRYALTSEPLAETASQTDQEMYGTSLNANRQLGSHLSLELALNQNLRFVDENSSSESLTDSFEWSTLDWLNYQFYPNLGAAVGVGFGYVNVDVGSDMTYEQVQGRINWQAGEKLGLVLNGGMDVRQFLDEDVSDLVNPIFGLSIEYRLFEETMLTIEGSHAVNASYFQNQVTETTEIGGSLRQRLFGKIFLDVNGGYRFSAYRATATGLSVSREDDNFYYNIRLSTSFLKRGTIAVFYHANENTSDDTGFSYSSEQVGVEVGFRY